MADALGRYFGNTEIARGNEIGFRAVENGKVPSGAKGLVERLSKVPGRLNGDNAVLQSARDASEMEEAQWMLTRELGFRKRQISAGLGMYKEGANFAIFAMNKAAEAGMVDTNFGRQFMRHNTTMSAQVNEVNGYEAAHKQFETLMEN